MHSLILFTNFLNNIMNNYDLTAQEADYSILLSASPYLIPQLLRINHHPEFYVHLENTFSFACFRTL